MTEEQLAFDIEAMLHEARIETAPEWTGAPLHFTTDYYPPESLDAALEHWQFLHATDKTHTASRMWRRSIAVPENGQITDSENTAVEHWHDHALPGWRDLPIAPHA